MHVPLQVHDSVTDAIRAGRPVVALETAVLTHGLPRTPHDAPPPNVPASWDPAGPLHLETMRAMIDGVRRGGAVPAAIGVLDGTLIIGLDDDQITTLAQTPVEKVGASNLAAALVHGVNAGTTVSATLAACRLPTEGVISVMATGGIGGVHRGWTSRPDISADLVELARSNVCVVCSGAKSILDLPATREALETLGVLVVGYRTDGLPRFVVLASETIGVSTRVEDARTAAALANARWSVLGQRGAVLVVAEVPHESAVDAAALERAVTRAEHDATVADADDAKRTPFLLDAVAQETQGRTLTANVALLVNNASLAAEVATALAAPPFLSA